MSDIPPAEWLLLIGLLIAIAWPLIGRVSKHMAARKETDREVLNRLAPRVGRDLGHGRRQEPEAPNRLATTTPPKALIESAIEPPVTAARRETTWKKVVAGLGVAAIVIAAAFGGSIGKMLGKSLFSPAKPTPQQVEEKLIEGFNRAAEQSNKAGPRMVDEDTRWDSTFVGPGARVTYFYSFPKYSSKQITASRLNADVEPVVRSAVCINKDMRPSLQYGGTYAFSYSGNDGVEIARFEFNRHDCNL